MRHPLRRYAPDRGCPPDRVNLITIEILGDSTSAQKAFKDVDQTQETFGKKLGGLAKAFGGAALAGGIAAFGKASVDAGSNVAESLSKVGVVFGSSAGKIEQFAATSTKAFGVSKGDALEAAGTFGNLAVSLGLPQEKAADMSTTLVGLGADMASFNNIPVDDALNALRSGLVGETEPLRALGVNLDDATLKAWAMSMGLYDGKGPLSAAAKAQAAYAETLHQTKIQQGDAARTMGGLAGQKKQLGAQVEDLQAKVGEKLVPASAKVTSIGLKVLDWVSNMSPGMQKFLLAAGGVIAVIAGVVKITQMWTAVQAAFNVVMAMNPVVLVVLAIVALIAVVVLAYQKVDWFRNFVDAAFRLIGDVIGGVVNWVKDNWPLLLAILTGPIGLAVLLIVKHWDTIKDAFTKVKDWIGDRIGDIVGFVTGIPGRIGDVASTMWDGIKNAFTKVKDWIGDRIGDIVGFVTGIKDGIGRVAGGMFDGIKNAFKSVLNSIIGLWNKLDFWIDFQVPDWVPIVGGNRFKIDDIFPDIPTFDRGGIVGGPIGSPQLVVAHGGETIFPTHRTGGGITLVNITQLDGREVARGTVHYTRDELLRMQKGRPLGFA